MSTGEEHFLTLIIEAEMISCNEKMESVMPTSQGFRHIEAMEIKIARIRAGLRQYEVAMSVGIPPARLSEIEAGRRQPSREVLGRILQVIEGHHDEQTKRKS